MEDTNTKKATTVGAYAEDVEFVNSIKGEFAARTENLATQLEAARADAEHGRGNVAFLSSQADDLRRQLDEARRENDRLRAQLDAREGGGR